MPTQAYPPESPHQQIIDYLAVEADLSPLTARSYISWEDVGLSKEMAEAALDDLIEAGIAVQRLDPHSGERKVGLRDYVEKADAEYEELKSTVYRKADERGLRPDWRPGKGWRLINAGGEIVTEGPMHALNAYLDGPAAISAA
jgi:hypothetical protein